MRTSIILKSILQDRSLFIIAIEIDELGKDKNCKECVLYKRNIGCICPISDKRFNTAGYHIINVCKMRPFHYSSSLMVLSFIKTHIGSNITKILKMRIKLLNLINQNESEVKYHIDRYPDGQIQLVLDNLDDNKCELVIMTRLRSSDDLFLLMQLSDIVSRRGLKVDQLIITYLLAARTDRLFNMNTSFTLKIVADVINSFDTAVKILTPHSDRSLSLINKSIQDDIYYYLDRYDSKFWNNLVLVAPDEGAADRLKEYVDFYGYKTITCIKKRSSNGSIESVTINNPYQMSFNKSRLLVLDDLCDGGGTFIAIAPELRKLSPKSLEIAVTHAIQKSGIDKLSEAYDKVYITDSYTDWKSSDFSKGNVYVIPILSYISDSLHYD